MLLLVQIYVSQYEFLQSIHDFLKFSTAYINQTVPQNVQFKSLVILKQQATLKSLGIFSRKT